MELYLNERNFHAAEADFADESAEIGVRVVKLAEGVESVAIDLKPGDLSMSRLKLV